MLFVSTLLSKFAAACTPGGSFFGLPTWYKYLEGETVSETLTGTERCAPVISDISDVWLIAAAILDMLLRLAILAAIAFVVVGGVKYIVSQGQSDQTEQAKNTIVNGIVGLVISIAAATLVTFIAGRF